jgi:Mrp family chromosome partitioning ATPase
MELFGKKKEGIVHAPRALLGEQAVHTHFAEAYRTLRTNIHLASLEQNVSSVLVTSAGQGEGKTCISANLGWTIARQGKSVVLVDCDLRRPSLSKTVDSSSSMGVTGLVADVLGNDINDSIKNKDCGLPDLLTLIDLQKRNGKLLVRDAADTFELFFLKGRAVDIAWLTCSQHLELPSLLHSEGLLSKEQLGLAVKQQQNVGHQLGSMISSMGLADEARLKGVLTRYVAEVLQRMNAMSAPSFLFTELPAQQISQDIAGLPEQIAKAIFSRNELPYIDSCIRQAAIQAGEHLAILPCGAIPPNPSELIGSTRLHFILSRLKHLYDFMIIDTPPVLPVSDALLLAPHIDGVIVVTQVGCLNRFMIGKAIEQLRDAKAHLLGLVLNQVDIKREGYYQKYASVYYGG